MFTINQNKFNNLEEQVQWLTDYHKVNQGLIAWGIRVVGQVDNEGDLPDRYTYEGQFGDAYAVGTEPPYNYWIWTRQSSEPGATGYWFNFGEISIVGPEGPQGERGERGEKGEATKIIALSTQPSNTSIEDGTIWLNTINGNVYTYNSESQLWIINGNVRGPRGIQGIQGIAGPAGPVGPLGEKGDKGDPSGLFAFRGPVANPNLLPPPSQISDKSIAYLVGESEPYNIWIQTQPEGQTSYVWKDLGQYPSSGGGTSAKLYKHTYRIYYTPQAYANYTCYRTTEESLGYNLYSQLTNGSSANTIGGSAVMSGNDLSVGSIGPVVVQAMTSQAGILMFYYRGTAENNGSVTFYGMNEPVPFTEFSSTATQVKGNVYYQVEEV